MFTLLAVDDDRAILELLSLALERPGLQLITTSSVIQAVHAIEQHPVDAAILDVHLTAASLHEGLDVLRYLRQVHPDAEAVVISGSAEPGLGVRAVDAGAWSFQRKPLSLPLLERQLAALGLPANACQRSLLGSAHCWALSAGHSTP